jgi:hypothetical protein
MNATTTVSNVGTTNSVPTGMNTAKMKVSGVVVFGTNDKGLPAYLFVGEEIGMGSFLNPVSPITAPPVAPTLTAPQPVLVETPKLDTDERAALIAEYKTLNGNAKGMGKASVEHLKHKIAELKNVKATVAAPTLPAAKVEPVVAAPTPPAPKVDAPKKAGGSKTQSDMPVVNRNVTGLCKANYTTKKNKLMVVYLVEHNTAKNTYKVFSPAKEQPEGLMPGFVAGAEWWAGADKISAIK